MHTKKLLPLPITVHQERNGSGDGSGDWRYATLSIALYCIQFKIKHGREEGEAHTGTGCCVQAGGKGKEEGRREARSSASDSWVGRWVGTTRHEAEEWKDGWDITGRRESREALHCTAPHRTV